jgi:23S rRNA pseudouridine1911/1915/1917 synthase
MATEFTVPAPLDGSSLDAVVRELFGLSWGKARAAIETGKVSVDGARAERLTARAREGQVIRLDMNARRVRPDTDLERSAIAYEDGHVLVVHKPAGISTVPFDESETGTLVERVNHYLRQRAGRREPPSVGVVHRIDKETTGLVVFTKSWLAKQSLASQFRAHTVHRIYYALVHGVVRDKTIRSSILADRGDGLRGSARSRPEEGQHAVTHVRVKERLEGATLVECKLETGRTHQIRIHLSEDGHPLLGERVYIRNFKTDTLPAARLMLHAAELGFVHPKTELDVAFEAPLPADMRAVLARLGSKKT